MVNPAHLKNISTQLLFSFAFSFNEPTNAQEDKNGKNNRNHNNRYHSMKCGVLHGVHLLSLS